MTSSSESADLPSQAPDPLQSPGFFWRRIRLYPTPGLVSAGLEDDFHRFRLQLRHVNGVITRLDTYADRFPWSTCPEAGTFLDKQMVGKRLEVVAGFDPHSHCTHFFELLVLCAAHALDPRPTQFDLRVPDRQQHRTSATLSENDSIVLRWEMNGTFIEGPVQWAGRDLRELARWKQSLSDVLAERAMLLRRAVHISNGRNSNAPAVARASDRGPGRMGACFTYQMPRALNALRSPAWVHDFSLPGSEPLQDFNPLLPGAASGNHR